MGLTAAAGPDAPVPEAPGAAAVEPETLVAAPSAVLLPRAQEGGTHLETAWDGGLLRPLDGPLEAPESGDHWLALASRDAAGNLSPLRFVLVRVDGEPPAVHLEIEPAPVAGEGGDHAGDPDRWLPPRARGRLRAEDSPAGVARVTLTSGSGIETAEFPRSEVRVTLPASGEVVLSGWAEDRVGNRSPEQRLTARVDAEPPRCRIQARGPWIEAEEETGEDGAAAPQVVLGPGATLEAAAEDGESGVARRHAFLDGVEIGEAGTAAPGWQGPWRPGRHRAELAVTDRVGNEGRCRLPFLLDAQPPKLAWRVTSSKAGGSTQWQGESVYRPPVTVEVSAEDRVGVDRVEWSEDGESFSPLPPELVTSRPSLVLRAVDRVGNSGEVQAAWHLDGEAPQIRLRLPDGSAAEPGAHPEIVFGQTVTLEMDDAGSGVAERRVWLNASPLAAARVIDFKSPGKHLLEVEAHDGVGNRSRTAWEIRVWRRKP